MLTWIAVPGPRTTLRSATVWSVLRIQTKSPWAPVRTAVTGTTTVSFRVCRFSRTFTNCCGNSLPWLLGKRALAFTVPVVASTWLSRVEKVPWSRVRVLVRSKAVTGRVPRAAWA